MKTKNDIIFVFAGLWVLGFYKKDAAKELASYKTKDKKIVEKDYVYDIRESQLVPVRLASESVDLQFLEELLIKQIKRTDRFLRKDKRTVKDNFVFGKRYMAKKILSAIRTELNKAEKEAKKK